MPNSIYCETCDHWANPKDRLLYPNCDNDALGWVRCGVGNIIRRRTVACDYHTGGVAPLFYESEVERKPRVKTDKEVSELLSAMDFGKLLEQEIERIGRKHSV